jgi:hypothetical protein
MFGQPENNPTNLRVVKTARTADAINTAAKAGLRPLVKAVSPSSDIHSMVAVYQHPKTGEIKVSGDVRWEPKEGFESVLPHRTYYPYHFPEAFAAYLLPPDLKDGEPVWLEDVIEDIVAVWGNQFNNPRLEACEAIWTEGDFKIQFDPDDDAPHLVG